MTQLNITTCPDQDRILEERSYVVASIPGPVDSLKLRTLRDGSVALAVVGRVDSDGNFFNGDAEPKKSSIRVYDKFNVRLVSPLSLEASQHSFLCDSGGILSVTITTYSIRGIIAMARAPVPS